MLAKRRGVGLGLASFIVSACPICNASAQAVPRAAPPSQAAGQPKGCGINGKYLPQPEAFLTSSGDAELDQYIGSERSFLNRLFIVKPDLNFYDDGGSNYAVTQPRRWQAQILIGTSLVRQEKRLNSRSQWQIAMIGILAHEWAHAYQYRSSMIEKTYMWETHADYLAGWYLAVRRALSRVAVDPAPFARSLYAKPSNNTGYHNPDDYGPPATRVRAMLAGFEFGADNSDVDAAASEGFRLIENRLM